MKSKIPKAAKRLDTTHLAEGEVTGHFHAATGPGVALYEHEGRLWLDAPEGSEVVHQEHGPITVPAGQHERRIVQEYDHFAEEARSVVD